MRVSEITTAYVRDYLRLDSTIFDTEINSYIVAAKNYVKGKTNLNDMQIDTHEDITIAVMTLISDMFENHLYHQVNAGADKVNKIVDSILNLYMVDQI